MKITEYKCNVFIMVEGCARFHLIFLGLIDLNNFLSHRPVGARFECSASVFDGAFENIIVSL